MALLETDHQEETVKDPLLIILECMKELKSEIVDLKKKMGWEQGLEGLPDCEQEEKSKQEFINKIKGVENKLLINHIKEYVEEDGLEERLKMISNFYCGHR